MVTKNDLRACLFMAYLTDDMLDKIVRITESAIYDEREEIFRAGDSSDRFYMVKSGKILLEQRISEHMTVTIDTVTAGEAFGLAAIFEESFYNVTAVCAETSHIMVIAKEDFLSLLNANHSMGYMIMKQAVVTLKNRLDQRSSQFVRSIASHPDIYRLGH